MRGGCVATTTSSRASETHAARGGDRGPGHDAISAQDGHADQTGALLEAHLLTDRPAKDRAAPCQHEGGADIGVAGKGHLGGWREDADVCCMPRVVGRQHEARLRVAKLGGDTLHKRVPQAAGIRDDGQGVPAEAGGGEYIDHLVGDVGH